MHSEELDNKCRLCVGDIREDTKKYNINNVWINFYLVEHIKDTPNFALEDKAIFPKQVCKVCFNKMYRHKAAIEKHRKNQTKIPKARRSELQYSAEKVTIALEKDFAHGANNECKVCGNVAPVEEDPHVPHLQPSPGTFKRKDTSPILTPKSKRVDVRKPGTAKRTLLLEKLEPMDIDGDEEIQMTKKSTIGTKIASDREIVKEENIKDKSVAQLFTCNICEKLSRSIVKLDTCNHVFCQTCIYEWNIVSTKCIKCNKVFNNENIVKLHNDMRLVHESLEVKCTRKGCIKELNLHELSEHEENCHARSASKKTKLGHLLGDHKHKQRALERIGFVKKEVTNICKKNEEDEIDVIFALLTTTLEENEINLKESVMGLHELYNNGMIEQIEEKDKIVTVEESTALKNYTNMTSQNVVKTNRFHMENKNRSAMAPYSKIVECERDLDVGNVTYKLIDRQIKTVTKVHEKNN